MPIDREKALGAPPSTREVTWTTRDVLLYHLSLGAGADTAAGPELHLTYERGLTVLPTFAMVAGSGISAREIPRLSLDLPGVEIDPRAMLHAGQGLEVHRPLPAAGSAVVTTRVSEVWDKTKAAMLVLESAAADPGGEPLWTSTMRIWIRGEGGFGGESGPSDRWAAPDRPADEVLETATSPQQALLYRLNGDLNPLHADPVTARTAGFDRPILHGLATYGMVAKSVVDGVLGSDPERLRGLTGRFAGSLFPGETIRTSVWHEGDGLVLHAVCPERDEAPVLTHATAAVTR